MSDSSPDLILRPSGVANFKTRDPLYTLQLRYNTPVETDYSSLCRVSLKTAREIIAAGQCYWLFGEPTEDSHMRLKAELEKSRAIADANNSPKKEIRNNPDGTGELILKFSDVEERAAILEALRLGGINV